MSVQGEEMAACAQNLLKEIISIRKQMHMYAEKGFYEYIVSGYIADYMVSLGVGSGNEYCRHRTIGALKGQWGKPSWSKTVCRKWSTG
jgi:metal-dependent amidase/aminoacylase/carboxypeptidase family protein